MTSVEAAYFPAFEDLAEVVYKNGTLVLKSLQIFLDLFIFQIVNYVNVVWQNCVIKSKDRFGFYFFHIFQHQW